MKLDKFLNISRFIFRKSKLLVVGIVVFTLLVVSFINIYSLFYIYNIQNQIPNDYRIAVVFGAKVNKDYSPTLY